MNLSKKWSFFATDISKYFSYHIVTVGSDHSLEVQDRREIATAQSVEKYSQTFIDIIKEDLHWTIAESLVTLQVREDDNC